MKELENILEKFLHWEKELKAMYEAGKDDPCNIKSGWSSNTRGKLWMLETAILEVKSRTKKS